MMTDVMLDFESFGFRKNAVICQVGACYFDRSTGEIGRTFERNIDARTAVTSGGNIDADTVYWWLKQSPEAIASITKEPLVPITDAMNDLNKFLQGAKCVWSHATFDFVILIETLNRLNIKPLVSYKSGMDIRTLVNLAKGLSIKDFEGKREGTHHNGLDDCKFQVKYCVASMNKMNSRMDK